MTRWRAAATHLALSFLVIGGVALTAFLLWYPYGLYRVAGLDRILLVMLGIDLTAGPLLTLILFRPGKRGLKFDLFAVALAQSLFLSYGLHTLWEGRPVFLVGTPETFTLVFANEIDNVDLEQAPRPEWRRLSWTGPILVATHMPEDPTQRAAIVDELMAGGAGMERSPKYYLPHEDLAPAILAASRSRVGNAAPIGDPPSMPIVSRRGEGRMLVDPISARPLTTTAATIE